MSTDLKYTKKHLRANLIMGIVWLIIGMLGIVLGSGSLTWLNSFYFLLGAYSIVAFYWAKRRHYITITNSSIKLNRIKLFEKEIKIQNITRINRFAGEITIFSEKNKIVVVRDVMTEESKTDLDNLLKPIVAKLYPN